MYRTIGMLVMVVVGIGFSAPISISGVVSDQNGNGIAGATVLLASNQLSATTDAAGNFSLEVAVGINASMYTTNGNVISIRHGVITVNLAQPALVLVERFDMRGHLLENISNHSASPRSPRFELWNPSHAVKMNIIRVGIGQQNMHFRYFPLNGDIRILHATASFSDGKPLAKVLASIDTLTASASGYQTKVVPIASYEETVDIVLDGDQVVEACQEEDRTSAPNSVNVRFSGQPFGGPHEVVVETDPGLPKFTIFRPEDLGPGKKYPILAWGQGACSENGMSNPEFNGEFASHGYLMIADGTPNGSGGGCGSAYSMDLRGGTCLLEAIHWAIEENNRPCSQYYRSLDISKTAAFGFSCGGLMSEGAGSSNDPVLTTFMLNSSGMTSPNQSVIDAFQTPGLFLMGGPSDIAYENGKRDYEAIKSGAIPAMFVSIDVGHGGTYGQDNGGSFAEVNLAWLNWWLKGDMGETGKGYLVGSTCRICSNSAWEVDSKNLP